MKSVIRVASEQEMLNLGANLALILHTPCLFYLKGELGVGKTTLVRAVLRALGYKGAVKSPTYTLMESYELENKRIIHMDLYRIQDPEELEFMGFYDELENEVFFFIEWPERGGACLPAPDVWITISKEEFRRKIEFKGGSDLGNRVVNRFIARECFTFPLDTGVLPRYDGEGDAD